MAPINGQGTSRDANFSPTAMHNHVSASNSTTNLWLKQRRVPAWMNPSQRPAFSRRVASIPSTTSATSLAPIIPAQPVQAQTRVSSVETVLPSPAPSDEPSPRAPNVHPSPPVAPTTNARFAPIEAPVPSNGPSGGPRHPTPAISVNSSVATAAMASPIHSPSVNPTAIATAASLPSLTQSNTQPLRYPSQATAQVPAKRSHTDEYESQGLRAIRGTHALETLRAYLQSIGGYGQLERSVEQPRFSLLNDACSRGDMFFLILHQLFCLWTSNPVEARQICLEHHPNVSSSSFETALGILGSILRSNTSLNPVRLQWLARYPASVSIVRQNYGQTLKQVTSFMARLSQHWQVTIHNHANMGYPLLMAELLGIFLLYSPVLQMIVFRASRRSVGITDEGIGARMDELFQQDQHWHLAANGTHAPADREQHNARLIQNYANLLQQQQRDIRPHQRPNVEPVASQNSRSPAQVSAQGNPNQVYASWPSNVSSANAPACIPHQPFRGPMQSDPLPSNIQYQNNTAQQATPHSSFVVQSQDPAAQQQRQIVPSSQSIYHPHAMPSYDRTTTVLPQLSTMMSTRTATSSLASTSVSAPDLSNQNRNVNQSMASHSLTAQSRGFAQVMAHGGLTRPVSCTVSPITRARIEQTNYPRDPSDRLSVENSLHQAHLRSPPRGLRIDSTGLTAQRHYQIIKSFLVGPSIAAVSPCIHKYRFTLPDSDWGKLIKPESIGTSPYRYLPISSGSLSLRLRCCFMQDFGTAIPSESWVVMDTAWPEEIYVELNSTHVGVKRKAHYSKDLPTDISSLAKPGENTLDIHIPHIDHWQKGKQPAIAVEVVEVLDHKSVLELVQSRPKVSATTTRKTIRKRLEVSSNDSDDLAVVVGDLHVNLADPFSSSIYTIPVRGIKCSHLECFDLETWLNTRPRKILPCICKPSKSPEEGQSCKQCQQEPTFPDKWKCPVCDGDARPCSLVIDDYFVKIRQELETLGKLKVKTILISPDGEWEPKEDPGDDDETDCDSVVGATAQAPSIPRGPAATMNSNTNKGHPMPREIIELD